MRHGCFSSHFVSLNIDAAKSIIGNSFSTRSFAFGSEIVSYVGMFKKEAFAEQCHRGWTAACMKEVIRS